MKGAEKRGALQVKRVLNRARNGQGRNLSYKESVSWLYSLQKYGIKFGLSRTSNLLKAFGDPHRGQRYIHIAGTNGKGSIGAMLESIFMRSGLKVGFYSSPHLVRFTERFRINRVLMEKHTAASLIEELKEVTSKGEPPTFFELTTAMALIYFFRSNVDVGIIEVGMGGRLDATNVIHPMVAVITNIGLEHQEFLGHTIDDIAREKGGVIKRGIDVVTAVNQPSVIRLFSSLCQRRGAPLWRLGHDAHYRRLPSGLLGYYGLRDRYRDLEVGLEGRFQYRNAALALLTGEIVRGKGLPVPEEAMRSGLADLTWPGRLELVSSDPRMILDGAHNPAAMRSLAYSVRNDFDFEQLILILGIMKDKDILGMLRAILPLATRVIYTRPNYYRAAGPECLMDMGKGFGKAGEIQPSVPEAIGRAGELAGKRDLIVITGSLFTVGEAKSYLDPLGYPAEDI